MKLWQVLVATLLAVLLVSFLTTALWRAVFDARMPSYIAGMVGGVAAVFVWSFLQRYRHKNRPGDGSSGPGNT